MQVETQTSVHRGTVLAGAGINLFVASADRALVATCKEVLRELEAQRSFDAAPSPSRVVQACLWDFEPGQQNVRLPEPSLGQETFYVVRAAHLDQLRANFPEAEGHILLKPVTPVVLRAFLGSLILVDSTHALGDLSFPSSARASQDLMLQQLLHANLQLQQYDQQRTNFIARALHDFRAPLTALSGFCGLLASGELGPLSAVQQEALTRMQRSTGRLSHMTSAMFELSAGPRVGRTPDLQEGDILEPIRQAIHEIGPRAREKHIEVRAENLAPPPAPLSFESSQMEQVLVNLLDNACKFVPKYGFIEVNAYPYFWERQHLSGNAIPGREKRPQGANSYRIDIKDSGPGIAPELLEHIFEEYTSYSGPQDRSGGGLGLAICRLIISRHQGHVWAEASADGSVFSFVLPLRPAGAIGGAQQ